VFRDKPTARREPRPAEALWKPKERPDAPWPSGTFEDGSGGSWNPGCQSRTIGFRRKRSNRMKISGSGGYSPVDSLLQRIQKGEELRAQRTEAMAQPRGEKVEISSHAREIQNLKTILDSIPDVREKKVEEIRRMIDEGSYQVDLGKLSDRILQALIQGDL
jgi:negative regulator of flagellin synthesis FlgM